mmetsp:Transcript_16857/g.21882  ORF Transcript_16857/g.21882 Transcript_16857/m.21882 type:complete len:159 (-) Transcript_16857:216-692(-)
MQKKRFFHLLFFILTLETLQSFQLCAPQNQPNNWIFSGDRKYVSNVISLCRQKSLLQEKADSSVRSPRVEIEYCPGCRWLLRSAWMAQELLSTFEEELGEVALQPSSISGTFQVRLNGQVVWDRKADSGFPEAKELKQRVRDIISPQRDLGHSDVKTS